MIGRPAGLSSDQALSSIQSEKVNKGKQKRVCESPHIYRSRKDGKQAGLRKTSSRQKVLFTSRAKKFEQKAGS